MKELGENLVGTNKQIIIKESRCKAGAVVKNFKLCDQLSDEIAELKKTATRERRSKGASEKGEKI